MPPGKSLQAVTWEPRYTTSRSDLVKDFYAPALDRAVNYDRATGYFRSSFYGLTRAEVAAFALRGGKIRLICSPDLDPSDIEEIDRWHVAITEANVALKREVERVLDHPHAASGAEILAALLGKGCLDIRLAVPSGKGIFHDKFGIFTDGERNRVSFAGSINETWKAWHPLGNHESFEVFTSWAEDATRTTDHDALFEDLWESRDANLAVTVPTSEVLAALKTRGTREPDEVLAEVSESVKAGQGSEPRLLFDHQRAALRAWEANERRGILKHATGSGKTITALAAIRKHLASGRPAVVVVPSTLLVGQWDEEARRELACLDPAVLLAGGGHSGWREHLRAFTLADGDSRLTIATVPTASSAEFLDRLAEGEHLFLVSDEVHRLGAPGAEPILRTETGPRLGLSATPERSGDPDGTKRILKYFDGIVPPDFTLADAIAARRLTPYQYHVHIVELDGEEQDNWEALTRSIRRRTAMVKADKSARAAMSRLDPQLKWLLIRRARLARGARGKAPLVASIVARHYVEGEHWLVYCDDTHQLREARTQLAHLGIASMEYRSEMISDREATLSRFERDGGVVVAIKCLDEGVDIPAISHAVIAASSRNPREFIQRRGRVLRRHRGKLEALIHDVIVRPPDPSGDDYKSLVAGEIARALEFSTHAVNESAVLSLQRLAIEWDLDPDIMSAAGFEEEEECGGGVHPDG